MQHLLTLDDWTPAQVRAVLDLAARVKERPADYARALTQRTLLMIFEKPSLRTRLSFETGMTQMGGHAIYYDTSTSPMGAGKESLHDTAKTFSRYVDIVMARLFRHADLEELARHATIPIINALTDHAHPCQILADLLTVQEKKGELAGLKLAYLGDSNNNVTHSLMIGGAMMGMHVAVGCPADAAYAPQPEVCETAQRLAVANGGGISVHADAAAAVAGADVVYTDSWMSYHIPKDQLEQRVEVFMPYQVNQALMGEAATDAIFMNCLPAIRGYEQTVEVIDGPQSVVFDQAENRLHAQKAVLLMLLQATDFAG
jgi:ornithine carbamoyltransferase